ncbi:hypothetical protein BX666DRAFT_1880298 [Dichotomocladium elegans]|nr:hypothetical protein BX666DRAFT_1880298 [Dichotomocladium elegans]
MTASAKLASIEPLRDQCVRDSLHRHDFPLAFVDMVTPGEQFNYILSVVKQRYSPNLGEVNAPLYSGVFPAYGHDLKRQMDYHPRLPSGFGLTDDVLVNGEYMTKSTQTLTLNAGLDQWKIEKAAS